jgi:hypothetical protein
MKFKERIIRALSRLSEGDDACELIISKMRVSYIGRDGTQIDGDWGVQVIWRDQKHHRGFESFEIFEFSSRFDIEAMSDVEVMRFIQNKDHALDDLIVKAEETLQAVTIGGEIVNWAELDAEGYEFISINKWHNPSKQVNVPLRR